MTKDASWELLERKKVYNSKFLSVYEDRVKLPRGEILDNYTVVRKPNIVIVVATDQDNNIITLREYKHAQDKILRVLPAGQMRDGESAVETAKRELLEETGYGGGSFKELGVIYDYPTKDLHKVYIVRAEKVREKSKVRHENSESININVIAVHKLRKEIKNGDWQVASAIASLVISGILF